MTVHMNSSLRMSGQKRPRFSLLSKLEEGYMKIVLFDESNWKMDHPTGEIAFQHMLKGADGTPENFMYILGRQDRDFLMPRHRHNFDQIRLPIRGTMSHGNGVVVGQGEVAYIPEGLPYGPQDDPLAPYGPEKDCSSSFSSAAHRALVL